MKALSRIRLIFVIVVVGVLLVTVGAGWWWVMDVSRRAPSREGPRGRASTDPSTPLRQGWTELLLPPEAREGAALVWVGSELLAWGGCDVSVEEECAATADGFRYDPDSNLWSRMPAAPERGVWTEGVWTGEEALFLRAEEGRRLNGQAFDPVEGAWRDMRAAPIAPEYLAVVVWTDSEVIVWGSGRPRNRTPGVGAAYDPRTDSWRRIADAPLGLNLASGMWTGSDVLVFGSLLDSRNWAATPTSVGAAYDPGRDMWRELPASALSPQATTAAWLDGRVVAWDYGVQFQEYDPQRNVWTAPSTMPFEPSECYPDSAVVGGLVFGFYCGYAALYDPTTGSWREVDGGPLDGEIWSDAYRRDLKLWRFGYLVPAGDTMFLLAEGITLNHRGVACYGCEGSPVSFWAYRPPGTSDLDS